MSYSQTETYCLPIGKARLLVEDATKKRVLDTIVNQQDAQIELLTRQNVSMYNDFQDLLKVEKDKFRLQKEITDHTESILNTYQEEKKSLKKQVRRLKWQRVGLGVIVVAAIVVSL